jgi:hypothetical protein
MELKLLLMGIACAFAGLISFATYVKWREIQAAKSWLPTPGTITSSRSEMRTVASMGSGSQTKGKTETRNFPAISFTYQVKGRKFTGTRYSLRENLGNFAVAETLAQYPKGAAVTVFYDPANPAQAVIERTMLEGAFKFMICLSAGLVLGALILIITVGGLIEAAKPYLAHPQNAGAAVLMAIISLFALRMAFAQRSMALAAADWPSVAGVVTQSGLDTFKMRDGIGNLWYRPWHTMFRSRVVYGYQVDGVAYTADRISFGAELSASLPFLVGALTRRYPNGSAVNVFYDPANPAQAVLEPRIFGLWVLWATTAVMAAGAAKLLGLI